MVPLFQVSDLRWSKVFCGSFSASFPHSPFSLKMLLTHFFFIFFLFFPFSIYLFFIFCCASVLCICMFIYRYFLFLCSHFFLFPIFFPKFNHFIHIPIYLSIATICRMIAVIHPFKDRAEMNDFRTKIEAVKRTTTWLSSRV